MSFAPIPATPAGIKVAEHDDGPAVGTGVPPQNLLEDSFALAVCIDWISAVIFRDGNDFG